MPQSIRASILGVAIALMPALATAASVRWDFEAVVREVVVYGPQGGDPTQLAEAVSSLGGVVGAPLVGSMRFETLSADVDSDPNRGDYRGAITVLDVAIGNAWSLSYDPGALVSAGSQIVVSRVFSVSPPLFVELISGGLIDPTGTLGRNVLLGMDLYSLDPSVFPDDSLPSQPPDLASLAGYVPYGQDPLLGYGTLALFAGCGDLGCASFYSEIVEITLVPEPGASALLGVGLASLAALRRRSS